MNDSPHQIPRKAIQSIGGGLFLMAFFTLMWTGIAQAGLQGRDHRIVLIVFSAICLMFVFFGIRFFMRAKQFPKFTTPEDELQGKRTSKQFGIIFGIEGLTIPLAAVVLNWLGYEQYFMAAIALIVGLHFYPMAKIFNRKIDYYLATWTCVVALLSMYMIYSNLQTESFVLAFLGISVALTTTTYGMVMISAGNSMMAKSLLTH